MDVCEARYVKMTILAQHSPMKIILDTSASNLPITDGKMYTRPRVYLERPKPTCLLALKYVHLQTHVVRKTDVADMLIAIALLALGLDVSPLVQLECAGCNMAVPLVTPKVHMDVAVLNMDGHCLTSKGCQSGCNDVSKPLASQEPVIVRTTSAAPPNSTAPVTSDGKCGASKGGTVCGDWPYGNCCSMYGFCGNTSAHCGAGCQSGNCLSAAVAPASGPRPAPAAPQQGSFAIIGQSGVPAMHAALLPNGRVVFLDKLENYTQVRLPGGHYAMSAEYNPADNTVVPLAYKTNAFCCGGCFLADGSVVSLGGNAPLAWLDPTIGDGFDAVRYLHRSSTDPSLNGRNWTEPGNKLASNRWYASAQTMSNGSIFVASGSLNGLDPTVLTNNNPTYEILNASAVSQGVNFVLDILKKNQPYYMYPFLHLLPDDSLFIFVSKSSEQYSVASQRTIKTFPELSGDYRTYPNTGSSVLLPLSSSKDWRPEIIICGGGAYQDITSPTDPSCGRIQPFSDTPEWEMDAMPEGRGMVEGTLLPDGTIIWLNGGNRGAQGFGLMADPTQTALLYEPGRSLGQRFSTLASSDIPRLYHSVALLLLDGTLMVAGSNPVQMPVLTPDAQNPYATEFRVERYTPPYLEGANSTRRPKDIVLSCKTLIPKATFTAVFSVPAGAVAPSVVLYQGGFVTHSLHMGHRMVVCDTAGWVAGNIKQNLIVTMPPNSSIVPPGPYVVYVLADGIPGIGQFVRIGII
ncbi:MAG: hypothetical protein M1818_002781 [Claussenomyces sp. TS43310]|nr:MAG: hypothetical protein M1818_002781 [Claussenomyces sp. TS43310]